LGESPSRIHQQPANDPRALRGEHGDRGRGPPESIGPAFHHEPQSRRRHLRVARQIETADSSLAAVRPACRSQVWDEDQGTDSSPGREARKALSCCAAVAILDRSPDDLCSIRSVLPCTSTAKSSSLPGKARSRMSERGTPRNSASISGQVRAGA
jgi:hypothetical protein